MVVALLVTEAGLHWALALLLAMAANVVVVAWALARARKLAPLLGLPATQRHLTLRSPAQPAPPSKPPEPSPTLAGTHA